MDSCCTSAGRAVLPTERKHLALFVSGLYGGAQRATLRLARQFALMGHRVDLLVGDEEGPLVAELPESVRLVRLAEGVRWPRHPTLKAAWLPAVAPALLRYLRHERPDVLLSRSNPPNLLALWTCRLGRVSTPVVVTANTHNSSAMSNRSGTLGPVLRTLLRRSYPRADGIVAVSDSVASDLSEFLQIPRDRISAIYSPVPVEEVQDKARAPVAHAWLNDERVPVILGVGKLQAVKDFATLIEAFARVREQEATRLILLGEGRERRKLELLSHELGVAEDVAMPGFVDNPYAWMSRASAFVLSSRWDGFPNVLCEALACGCPVVSTRCPGGAPEILDGGRYGRLVPVGDVTSMSNAILELLRQPLEREKLQTRAAAFSARAAAIRYLDVMIDACSRKTRASGRIHAPPAEAPSGGDLGSGRV